MTVRLVDSSSAKAHRRQIRMAEQSLSFLLKLKLWRRGGLEKCKDCDFGPDEEGIRTSGIRIGSKLLPYPEQVEILKDASFEPFLVHEFWANQFYKL